VKSDVLRHQSVGIAKALGEGWVDNPERWQNLIHAGSALCNLIQGRAVGTLTYYYAISHGLLVIAGRCMEIRSSALESALDAR
jgi:hypothetical protein